MDNPLTGKTVIITYETGFPEASVEINFFSRHQKTSTNRDPANPRVSTDTYDAVVIVPKIYMASWIGEDGHVVTSVFNLNDMRINSTYSNPELQRIVMAGIINEIR